MMRENSRRDGTRLFGETVSQIEADETFIGGKARNMHVTERQLRISGGSGKGKKLTGKMDCVPTES